MSERIPSSALYQQVADRLRRRIYQHELHPGDAIDEKGLCDALGISRTPLREALKVLAAEGLVDLVPRRGCFVKRLDVAELDELFEVMAALEGLCARQAARRLTQTDLDRLEEVHAELERYAAENNIDDYYEQNRRFHQVIQELSGNRWLQRVAADLRRIMRLARHEQLMLPGRLQASLEEHRRVMEAFRAGDAELADRLMQEHLIQQGVALDRLAASGERPANLP